jgi:TonB-dependent receptor
MPSIVQRPAKPRARSSLFKLAPVAAGCAVLIVTSSSAFAQAATPDLKTVTVVGIRKGIEDAISVKKNATSIVEAVSAEDIGKLPDVSIGESISRLPGLSAQRVAGRAQVISVRGLSPDFATTLLNGREMVSTGDNRSVEFDQYPSELLSGVTVYKTPDAGLVGQGLSGTLDMQTVRPLSFPSRVVTVNVRGENNSLGSIANSKSTGNRVSASYIDQFANGTVGLALGFAHMESPVSENQVGLYEPWEQAGRPGVADGTYVTAGMKSLARSGYNKRDGFMGVLEVKPSKTWNSVLDVFSSRFKKEDTANQFEVHIGGYNGGYTPGLNFSSATTAGGILTGGTATGVYPLVRGMYNNREDAISAIGWSNKFKFDGWSLLADVNYSGAKRDELSLENNLQLGKVGGLAPLDAVSFNFRTGGFPSMRGTRNYSDPSQLMLDNTIYGSGYGKVPSVEDVLRGYKLLANFAAPSAISGLFSDIDVGLNFSQRTKTKHQPEASINLAGSPTTIPADLQYGNVDLGFSGTGMIPSWNVPGVVARYMTFNPSETAAGYLISKAWDVTEKITTSFIKANIDSQIGSVPVRGNFGVQVINTDQSSSSRYFDNSALVGSQVKPVVDGKTYTDVLPSLNMAFSVTNDQTVRFGLAQQMARPRVDQLRSALDFGVDTTTGKPGGSGGNAKLDPWRADAVDLSWEKYWGNKAYLSAALFYKDIKSYIYEQSKTYDFSKFTPGTPATTNSGNYSSAYNGQGGSLRGIELSASLPLGMLTPALDGFGVTASYAGTDSKITIQDPSSNIGTDIPLPGLSKNVTNLTLYYEKAGFSTRINQRQRSDFVGEIGNFANNRTLRYVVGENITDFQIGYTFNEGSYKGLGVLLQVNNLTDAAYQTYAGTPDKPYEYIKYGRSMLLGVNYKF